MIREVITFFLAAVLVATLDRVIPFHARRYAGRYFTVDSKEFWRRYGVISFPRAAFAVLFCVSTQLEYFTPLTHMETGYVAAALIMIWAVSAGVDTFRAGRPRDSRR